MKAHPLLAMTQEDNVTTIRQLLQMPPFVASDTSLSEEKRMMQILNYSKLIPMRLDFIRNMIQEELETYTRNHPDASHNFVRVETNRQFFFTTIPTDADPNVKTFWFNIPAHLSLKE